MKKNPFDERLAAFAARMEKLNLDIAIVADEATVGKVQSATKVYIS